MGTVGLPENSPPSGSALRLPTTPLCASTTGSGRRRWPISSCPQSCTASSIAMPSSAVRCSTSSLRPTTGASCRLSTPLIWCSARKPSSSRSMNSFPGRPSSPSKPNTSRASSATRSLPNSPKRSPVSSQPGSRAPASSIALANPRSRSMTNLPSSCASRPTTNDVSTFKHYRKVEHHQGPASYTLAPVKKNIYSLTDLRHIMLGCNRRYLEYLSSLDDFVAGIRTLDRLTQPRPVKGRTLRGLNFFSRAEQTLLATLQRPAFNIAGLRRADLLPLLARCSPPTLTRHLARLRQLGVIKRVTGTYRYYLTRAGRAAIAAGRRLTEHTIIPALA